MKDLYVKWKLSKMIQPKKVLPIESPTTTTTVSPLPQQLSQSISSLPTNSNLTESCWLEPLDEAVSIPFQDIEYPSINTPQPPPPQTTEVLGETKNQFHEMNQYIAENNITEPQQQHQAASEREKARIYPYIKKN